MSEVRLQKLIASSGLASRREAERLIISGRVWVNGKKADVLGTKVDPLRDDVRVDGKPVQPVVNAIYLMLNKPRSVVTTVLDPQGRTTVMDLIGKHASTRGPGRVFHVGRLDYASEGLLLLTNDGQLAHILSHPANQVPRTYHARVRGAPCKSTLARLRQGIKLEDGPARVVDIQTLRRNPKSTWLEITLVEGRQRLVRRMLAAVNHPVHRLIRVAYAGVELGELRPGQTRSLTSAEIKLMRNWNKQAKRRIHKSSPTPCGSEPA